MNYSFYLKIFGLLFCCLIITMLASASDPANVPRIDNQKLASLPGDPNVIIIDVRQDSDWERTNFKIKGAIRKEPREVEKWLNELPKNKTLVFYCA